MPYRNLLAVAIALLLAPPAGAADASDVVGLWSVDTAALQGQMERMMEAQVTQLPEEQRAQAMAMARAHIEPMIGQMAGEAEFKPDGTVIFTSGNDPASSGTWSLEGGQIRFARDQRMPNEPAYAGRIDGDVIEVQPVDGPGSGGFTLTLRRVD